MVCDSRFNKKIIVGIDGSRSVDSIQKTGVEFVSDELIKQFINFQDTISNFQNFIFYTPEKISWLPEENQKILNWPFKFLWTQIRLSWKMLKNKPDIFFSPVHILPFFTPKKTFKIIHDIAFKKNKKIYNLKNKILLNLDLYRAIKKCEKIFVPSEQVKQDLLKYTKISEDKIIKINHGYKRKNFQFPISNFQLRKNQLLYIGRIEVKKNIINLIKAFEIFNKNPVKSLRDHGVNNNYSLILAGKVDNNYINKNINYFNNKNIKLLGYISEQEKFSLLRESKCLVYISKEEGFGIPILEAFDFNLPVVCSDIPVLREVGGDACIFVNPNSVQEIAKGIFSVIECNYSVIPQYCGIQFDLIEKAKQQLEKFSWQKAGEKYLQEILK